MIKTILIDDERPALRTLEHLLKQYNYIDIIGTFTDMNKAFDVIKKDNINVVFLDIEMPSIKGIEAAEKIHKINNKIGIVFVTAYDNYAVDAFEIDAVDYIMKPVLKRRLDKTIERILKKYSINVESETINSDNKIKCFGYFELINKSSIVKWRTAKSKELFAYLVHNNGKFVHKSKIIDTLWSEKEENYALKLLHTSIYYIRKSLKSIGIDKVIVFFNDMYKLNIENFYYDVAEFKKIISANSVIESKNIEILKTAVELYRGDYLEENDFIWTKGEQETIRNIYFNMLKRISEYYIEKKNIQQLLHI